MPQFGLPRRHALCAAAFVAVGATRPSRASEATHPIDRWFQEAEAMRKLAVSWGDQSYGAVLVLEETVVGFGPSRVVKDRNPDAHAERVAILNAQQKLGRDDLSGTVLYSTSRPCSLCEQAATQAKVSRMYFGPGLADGGKPSFVAR